MEYHKIQTVYKRNPHNMRFVLEGEWSKPEFEFLANNRWIFTEKVDGTNIRVMWDGQNITFNGKTDNAQMPMPLVYRLQELFETLPQKEKFREIFKDSNGVVLYGEGYGAKIQKGGGNYKSDGVDFVLFDVKVGRFWLERPNVEDIAVKLGIKVVPVIGEGSLYEAIEMVKNGLTSQWGDFEAEGIVARPSTELFARNGDRIITKIKARDFKLSSLLTK